MTEWLGDRGRLQSVEYSNRRAAFVGDTLRSTGRVVAVDRENRQVTVAVSILNQNDEVLAPGTIVASIYG